VSVPVRQTPEAVLTIVTSLSGIPVDLLQSPTQIRSVVQVRAAAAHLLRNHCGLPVKQVAPLLGRSDQTVCECSRKARLALVTGGRIAELIKQSRLVLDGAEPDQVAAMPAVETASRDGDTLDHPAVDIDPQLNYVHGRHLRSACAIGGC
jgi:predicted transcriptional regulator